jgi:hypothetical protein
MLEQLLHDGGPYPYFLLAIGDVGLLPLGYGKPGYGKGIYV